MKKIIPYIDRTDLKLALEGELLADTEKMSYLRTRIVCGPRGSGKSTLVCEVLQKEKGVVHLRVEGGTSEFASAVLQAVGLPYCPTGIEPTELIHTALKHAKSQKGGNKLSIFLIELDVRVEGKHLEELLLLLKSWGDDQRLVKCVIVLSSSQTA